MFNADRPHTQLSYVAPKDMTFKEPEQMHQIIKETLKDFDE